MMKKYWPYPFWLLLTLWLALGLPGLALAQGPGDLDTTFSSDGWVTSFLNDFSSAEALLLQPNGRIVVAGFKGDPFTSNFALARYRSNGTLDPSFAGNGKLTTDFGGADEARALALQPDGKIVAAGQGSGDFALARYNPDG